MEREAVSSRMSTKNFIILFALICFISSAGISVPIQGDQRSPLKIMASIFPLKEFAQAVVGELGTVDLLLPPGAEIHTWQPKPSDLVKLSSADVFIFIGEELEPWVDDILRSIKNPGLRVIEASKGITLLCDEGETGHNHEALDPHIWLDFANDETICDMIAALLSAIEPDCQQTFEKNAEIYKQKLRALDERYRKSLDRCVQRTIVLGGHGAFGYLARRYKLSQISLYGLSPDTKPTPRQLMEVINFVKENGIGTIFFEVSISGELARVIAEETGAKTLVLNPGANLPRKMKASDITFLHIMEKNLENLKNGLRCR
jgi:zinc transport system substrate-binding protein